jgi:hypothetical protein
MLVKVTKVKYESLKDNIIKLIIFNINNINIIKEDS